MAKSSSRLGRGLGSLIAGGTASKEPTKSVISPDTATLAGPPSASTERISIPNTLKDESIGHEKGG